MPVYGSHLASSNQNLSQRIRSERLRLKMTLSALGASAGITVSRLSLIENGRVVINLRQATVIAKALGTPLEALLPPDTKYSYQVTRDTDLKARAALQIPVGPRVNGDTPKHHNSFWPLAGLFVGRLVEPFLGQVMPVADDDLSFYTHHDQEFAFVLNGTVEFLLRLPDGVATETLNRGDSVYFKSDLPHCFRSLDATPATCLHVFSSATAPLETGIDWLSPHPAAIRVDNGAEPHVELVGERVSRLRRLRGWTIDELAGVVRVKPSTIMRIESDTTSLPLDVLLNLARAFGKPLRELLGTPDETPHYYVQRSRELASIQPHLRRMPADRPGSLLTHATYYPLAASFPMKLMFPYFVRIQNVELRALTMHEHHGQEFIYVLDGQLQLSMYAENAMAKETLGPGDCCYIDSSVPHLTRGYTRNPFSDTSAEVIDLFVCPLGEAYLFEITEGARNVHRQTDEDGRFQQTEAETRAGGNGLDGVDSTDQS